MKITNPDYTWFYRVYKKIPVIGFIATMLLSLVWGIIDWVEWITDIGTLDFGGFIIWLVTGAIVGAINMFLTSILISPVIVRTDATVAVVDLVKNGGSYDSNII